MDYLHLKHVLATQAGLISHLVEDVSPEQARWKPTPDRWSVVEVINHLYDEEREDFRVRLDIILYRPDRPWPPIHPMSWVTEREYNTRDLQSSLDNFLSERRVSLAWLESLTAPDWDAKVSNEIGSLRAGDMFASWVVHGQWHMQQLIQLRRDYTIAQVQPYDVAYAGTL